MRITDIEIKNFRAFYGEHRIPLHNAGKNLMVYGENGSGKSSLFLALKKFFESSVSDVPIVHDENIFAPQNQQGNGYIRLSLKENPNDAQRIVYELSPNNERLTGPNVVDIADANKIKGFFDYKNLLQTHFIDLHRARVNLFDILIRNILYHAINQFTNDEIGSQWEEIHKYTHKYRQGSNIVSWIKEELTKFNDGLNVLLTEIKEDANTFMSEFDPNVRVSFDYNGVQYQGRRHLSNQELSLNIDYCNQRVDKHQYFLNEARLSALAISLYLASIRVNPTGGTLKVLVLDDLLIGLDMSNRLPLLKILKDHFEGGFQIIMTTYDRMWFEVVRNQFGQENWNYVEIYSNKLKEEDFEIPVINDHSGFLNRAKDHLAANDFKASAVYIRTEFERLVKKYCAEKRLKVTYKKNLKELQSNELWESIVDQTNISEELKNDIETHRGTVMNPYSHYDLERPQFKAELEATIDSVELLQNEFASIRRV